MNTDENERKNILDELLPTRGEGAYLQGPIYFDYGIHTSLGKSFYVNSNFTVLDVCRVTIGDNVFIGPNVSIFTPHTSASLAGPEYVCIGKGDDDK
ncbi:hypothetical protein MCJ35_13800 [Enterocloster sp. OA13]|uniref:hypothetical protein n=1 Tax=Enterocloster sp. OA13 TaxID=2914161 RepID=UPI0004BAC628|nr:hypothetical protein [Enterocloster sp. OA13]